ncbi:putative hydrolase/esterase/lipase [Nocardioides baekrokdamisoli]|uniref:Putative hydrolase/esterase/lipase n=1 Tax=Nocardioides baekrokdamisoli TaxID=1804624 RepID=A0A3G9ICE3_9ACTN|nr:alpha/beta hydrolase [Nocardioides baekrokdamisoli]BBH16006.1 putative hydrolase/esterase/lipase [Nocardioides baekrokdamisoli]
MLLPLCARVGESSPALAPMSLRARGLSLVLRRTVRPIIGVWSLAPWFPWPYRAIDYAGLLAWVVPGTSFERTELGGVPVQRVTPNNVATGRRILYFHGGAFIVGGWHLHRGMLSQIAATTGAEILAVDYRQLPRSPISASVEDCATAYAALTAQTPASETILMGDSAGGYLVFSTLAHAAAKGLPMPAAGVTYSPLPGWRDQSDQRDYPGCAIFGPRAIPTMARYATSREISSAHLTPQDAVGPDLPSILIQAAAGESLYPDIEALAADLQSAGADVELRQWNLDVHVFQAMAGWIPEARAALEHAADFCERVWMAPARHRDQVG